jgi:hypothetical protein
VNSVLSGIKKKPKGELAKANSDPFMAFKKNFDPYYLNGSLSRFQRLKRA